jgi:photosystem II PsbU protein
MRFIPTLAAIAIAVVPAVNAFGVVVVSQKASKPCNALCATRRDFVGDVVAGVGVALFLPTIKELSVAYAFSQQLDDYAFEPQQQATDGKIDLNSAFVGDYKELRGMFPTAAGKIASHGPFQSVKDIYNIPGLTANDIALFRKYEKEFTVHPPGRSFYERINARVST